MNHAHLKLKPEEVVAIMIRRHCPDRKSQLLLARSARELADEDARYRERYLRIAELLEQ